MKKILKKQLIKSMSNSITTGNVTTPNTPPPLQITNLPITPNGIAQSNPEGIKDDNEKLYYELDWEFIENMAKTMSENKSTYPKWNWQKPMPEGVERLKQSLIRHVMEVLKSNYNDGGNDFGHLYSIALNAMMINYQLQHHGR